MNNEIAVNLFHKHYFSISQLFEKNIFLNNIYMVKFEVKWIMRPLIFIL